MPLQIFVMKAFPKFSLYASDGTPLWRDGRVLGVFGQVVFLAIFVLSTGYLLDNVRDGLWKLGDSQFLCRDGSLPKETCFFEFLSIEAQFDIAEKGISYTPNDSYGRAILVGLVNTIKVSVLGIVLSSVLGVLVGIAALSSNWLVSRLAQWYVDLMRNTPLVLILLALYLVVLLQLLPDLQNALQPFGLPIYLSQRGVNYPWLVAMESFGLWRLVLMGGLVPAFLVGYLLQYRQKQTEKNQRSWLWAGIIYLLIAGIGWVVASQKSNQQLLISRTANIQNFEQLITIDAPLSVCTVRDSMTEINAVVLFRQLDIAYEMNRSSRIDQALQDYTAGDCLILVASSTEMSAALQTMSNALDNLRIDLPETPLRLSIPYREKLNFVGGGKLTPEFAAVLFGLTIYTAAFIAEIVRAGILAIPKGQTEAARALGLSESQRLRLIILPQALRVIIPPTTSQYLNLTKNSSLAQFVAFPDVWTVSFTTINQSGRSVQIILIVMLLYLTISLLISALLNWYNRRVALVER